jgi:hypothetical protein
VTDDPPSCEPEFPLAGFLYTHRGPCIVLSSGPFCLVHPWQAALFEQLIFDQTLELRLQGWRISGQTADAGDGAGPEIPAVLQAEPPDPICLGQQHDAWSHVPPNPRAMQQVHSDFVDAGGDGGGAVQAEPPDPICLGQQHDAWSHVPPNPRVMQQVHSDFVDAGGDGGGAVQAEPPDPICLGQQHDAWSHVPPNPRVMQQAHSGFVVWARTATATTSTASIVCAVPRSISRCISRRRRSGCWHGTCLHQCSEHWLLCYTLYTVQLYNCRVT